MLSDVVTEITYGTPKQDMSDQIFWTLSLKRDMKLWRTFLKSAERWPPNQGFPSVHLFWPCNQLNFQAYRYRKCLVEELPYAASALCKALLFSQYHQSRSYSYFRPDQMPLPHKAFPECSVKCDPESSGQPADFIFNSVGYPKPYTCMADIIIYVWCFLTWGLKYGMH